MPVARGLGDSLKDLIDEFIDRLKEHKDDERTAAAIRKNTEALSGLSSNPPSKEPNVSTDPGQSVDQALSDQTDAIARLSAELADEHAEWVAAVEAGDTGAADAVVEKVKANTDRLSALADDLASSHPGSSTEPTPTPQGPTGVDEQGLQGGPV